LESVKLAPHHSAWDRIGGLVSEEGSAPHPHLLHLLTAAAHPRDLSDAVHALCAVHGSHPGMIDEAHQRCVQPDACDWLAAAAAGFSDERGLIAQLTAAAGPLPSTPGQAESEAALAGVRHAIEMLARSDRGGTATGAAAALVADWMEIRHLLAHCATAFGIALPPTTLPSLIETQGAVTHLADSPSVERAMTFGARQLLAQHRGLWDLLEARRAARG